MYNIDFLCIYLYIYHCLPIFDIKIIDILFNEQPYICMYVYVFVYVYLYICI